MKKENIDNLRKRCAFYGSIYFTICISARQHYSSDIISFFFSLSCYLFRKIDRMNAVRQIEGSNEMSSGFIVRFSFMLLYYRNWIIKQPLVNGDLFSIPDGISAPYRSKGGAYLETTFARGEFFITPYMVVWEKELKWLFERVIWLKFKLFYRGYILLKITYLRVSPLFYRYRFFRLADRPERVSFPVFVMR